MAVTWGKAPLVPIVESNSFLSLIERYIPEGASQTFPVGSPLKMASGLAVAFVAPSDADLAAFSLEAGHNNSGSTARVVLAYPGVEFEANFLGSAAADNIIAAADFAGAGFDLATDANLLGTGLAAWYLQDSTSSVAARISALRADRGIPANSTQSQPAIGDTNARVRCCPLFSILHWD
jgi:hypothetical protein